MGHEYKDFLRAKGIYECTECPLSNRRRGVCVYRGVPGNPVMIIGEAPGDQEDKQSKPMVGPTGSFLVQVFNDNGITLRDRLYITNTVLCHPPGDRTPVDAEMEACSYWLNLQITCNHPRFIIAAGKVASSRLLTEFSKTSRISDFEGKEYALPHYNATCIPIRHPSAILRAPSNIPDYKMLIERISNIIKKSLTDDPFVKSLDITK